ncbi:MAG TPA: hypothetical protein VMS88_00100, partial [Terriglobales bacterium]|nr:hypothetical protein [Terriglobales bacterium]
SDTPRGSKPARIARAAAALVAGLLVHGALAPMLAQIAAVLQIPVIAGLTVGLLAAGTVDAAAAGALAIAIGLARARPEQLASAPADARAPLAVALVLGTALVAGAVHRVARRAHPRITAALVAGAILIVTLDLWSTTFDLDATPLHGEIAGFTALAIVPPAGQPLADNEFYQRVLGLMQRGDGYYHAFRRAYRENPRWGTDPYSIAGYRLPTLFWFWRLLPGKPRSLVVALLALCTLAMAATARLAFARAPRALAVPAAALLAAYFLLPCTTNGLLMMEPWAACVGLISVACAAESHGPRGRTAWAAAAAATALLATLVRETMGFLLLAGLAASLRSPRLERRARLALWGAALGGFGLAYAAHAFAVAGAISRTGTLTSYLHGGLENLWLALSYATDFMGGPGTALLCGALAVAGGAAAREPGLRAHLLVALLAPTALLLVAGNRALLASGARINYWGPILVPLLVALAPLSAGALRPRPARE